METLQVGRAKLTWLNGGVTHLDGGAMFGVVPRPLWKKKYPVNENNQVELRTDPILLEIDGSRFLIDSGIGNQKMNDKMKRNFGVLEESSVLTSLQEVGLSAADLDGVLMTHLHFDHACGLTSWDGDTLVPTFGDTPIYTSAVEWDEMKHPNMRSKNTYWEDNWKPVEDHMNTYEEKLEIIPGLTMIHTGGHSDGHSILVFEDGEETFIHMADLMPTHGHQNPLWVLAYDDFPVTSVHQKKKWLDYGYDRNAWFTFYHDAYYRALQVDTSGAVTKRLERERYEYK
ncbi:YtnP family quorum-quenching lactonase [Thalassobacillus hwangdonensis]|uniref:MBL fold metallo-hydrolase n=1 Tax=Thalassobacillus hwangdonensis TaxID=546108 RepID=A0ABW3L3C1_9BACI